MAAREDDRVVAALAELTKQVSRVAWALEVQVIKGSTVGTLEISPCTQCGSQLVVVGLPLCPACLEPKKGTSDVGH